MLGRLWPIGKGAAGIIVVCGAKLLDLRAVTREKRSLAQHCTGGLSRPHGVTVVFKVGPRWKVQMVRETTIYWVSNRWGADAA